MFSDNIFSLCLLFGILYLLDGSRLSGGVACLVLESRHTHINLGERRGREQRGVGPDTATMCEARVEMDFFSFCSSS